MNEVNLIGNLGHDVEEVRYTSAGTAVINFRIATNEYYRGTDSGSKTHTEWHRIAMFGPRAANEKILARLKKGTMVRVKGKLRTTQWTDSEGVTRSTTEVQVVPGPDAFNILKDARSQEQEDSSQEELF